MAEPFIHMNEELLVLHTWTNQHPDLVAGFTTKSGGFSITPFTSLNLGLHVPDNEDTVILNRKKVAELLHFPLETWVCAEQIHGNQILKITENCLGKGAFTYRSAIGGTDGFYTYEKNVLLVLMFADCVPLYFFSPKHKIVGIAHAGWKGSVQNIALEMISRWKNQEKIDTNEIYAAIGPSIGPCCYLVDDRVINEVKHVLGHITEKPYQEVGNGEYQLDLKRLNYLLLLNAGVRPENITTTSYCTSCESNLFFSHRRDHGGTGRMMSFIALKED